MSESEQTPTTTNQDNRLLQKEDNDLPIILINAPEGKSSKDLLLTLAEIGNKPQENKKYTKIDGPVEDPIPDYSLKEIREMLKIPSFDLEEFNKRKEELIREYREKRLKMILESGNGYIDRSRRRIKEFESNELTQDSPKKRQAKIIALQTLVGLNRNQAENLYNLYQSLGISVNILDFIRDRNVFNNLKKYQPEDYNFILQGIKRLKLFDFFAVSSSLADQEITDTLIKIGKIDESVFLNLLNQLNRYFFLHNAAFNKSLITKENFTQPETKKLLEILLRGKLSEDEKNLLDAQLDIALLCNDPNFLGIHQDNQENIELLEDYYSLNLGQILINPPNLERLNEVRSIQENIVLRDLEIHRDDPNIAPNLLSNKSLTMLLRIFNNKSFDQLIWLSNQGIDCNFITSFSGDETGLKNLTEKIEIAYQYYQNKENLEWARIYEYFFGQPYGFFPKMYPKEINEYLKSYSKRNKIVDEARVINGLADITGVTADKIFSQARFGYDDPFDRLREYFYKYESVLNNNPLGKEISNIFTILKQNLINKLDYAKPESDLKYDQRSADILRILAYAVENQEVLTRNDAELRSNLPLKLIRVVIEGKIPVSQETYNYLLRVYLLRGSEGAKITDRSLIAILPRCNEENFSIIARYFDSYYLNENLNQDEMDDWSEDQKKVIALFKKFLPQMGLMDSFQLQEVYKYRLNLDRVFSDDNKIRTSFLEEIMLTNRNYHALLVLIKNTQLEVDGFMPLYFWEALKNLPFGVSKYLIDNLNRVEEIYDFQNGCPRLKLLYELADKTNPSWEDLQKLIDEKVIAEIDSQEIPEEEKKRKRTLWVTLKRLTPTLANYTYQNKERIDQLVDIDSGFVNKIFLYESIRNNMSTEDIFFILREIFTNSPESLSNREKTFFLTIMINSEVNQTRYAINNFSDLVTFIDENGKILPGFYLRLAKDNQIKLINLFLSQEDFNDLPEKDYLFWNKWIKVSDKIKNLLIKELNEQGEINDELIKKLEIYSWISRKIEQSKSLELKKIEDFIIKEISKSANPRETFEKIRKLFEENNLPTVGKHFRLFEILYFDPDENGKTRFERELQKAGDVVSPTLRKAGTRRRLAIIYRDLLKIHILGDDPNLRTYLIFLKEGVQVLDKIEREGLSSLSPEEKEKAKKTLDNLSTLYQNSLLSRQKKEISDIPESLDLQVKLNQLRTDLGCQTNQTIIQRISEMFLKPLGYESIDEVLVEMKKAKENAHRRNIANPRISEGYLVLDSGDLIKGTDAINYILHNGALAKEYIGPKSDSDRTPFDADTVMITDQAVKQHEGNFRKIVLSSEAAKYGDVIIVIKNRGQFNRTDTIPLTDLSLAYDYDHYELFYSGVYQDHYGIRTGIPATEIDAIIIKLEIIPESEEEKLPLQQLFFNIANNGFYIPIVNIEGKVIFTEQDYNQYKLDVHRLEQTLSVNQPDFNPQEIINILKLNPFFKNLFERSSGVYEGYTIEEHTLMVLKQFEKYFSADFQSTILSRDSFRLLLTLHDIGKSLSILQTGTKGSQHKYTREILEYGLKPLSLSNYQKEVIISIIDQDILGEYFQDKISLEEAVEKIDSLSRNLSAPRIEILKILRMFYICDAGSYTEDAGGKRSLDALFNFAYDEKDGKPKADFSSMTFDKFRKLEEEIIKLS